MRKECALVAGVVLCFTAVFGIPPTTGASFTAEQLLKGNIVTTAKVPLPSSWKVLYVHNSSTRVVYLQLTPQSVNGVTPTYSIDRKDQSGVVTRVIVDAVLTAQGLLQDYGSVWPNSDGTCPAHSQRSGFMCAFADGETYTYTVTAAIGAWKVTSDPVTVTAY